MVVSVSPNMGRRRSMAVLNTARPVGHRRRAHSIVPGEKLSPRAAARRSLAPRKSILKTAFNLNDDDDASSSTTTTTSTRRSIDRRVSFAADACIREFEKRDPYSPTSSTSRSQQAVNDENAYPGARRRSSLKGRRRSSLANNDDTMDMDVTLSADTQESFIPAPPGESALDSTDEEDGDDDEAMEVTEGLDKNIIRRRSSTARPRSSLPSQQVAADVSVSGSEVEASFASASMSQSDISIASSVNDMSADPVEYTVPVGQPLKPLESPSDAWLQLQAVANGDAQPVSDDAEEDRGDDMDLTSAMTRLRNARDSMGLTAEDYGSPRDFLNDAETGGRQSYGGALDDSFGSSDSSFGNGDGEETINITAMLQRNSLGGRKSIGAESAMSLDDDDSFAADQAAIYPDISELHEEDLPQPPAATFVPFRDPGPVAPSPARPSGVLQPKGGSSAAGPSRLYPTLPEISSSATERSRSPNVFSAPSRPSSVLGQHSRPVSALGQNVFSAPPRASSVPPSPTKSPAKPPPGRQSNVGPTSIIRGPVFTPQHKPTSTGGSAVKGDKATPNFTAAFAPPSGRKEAGGLRRASVSGGAGISTVDKGKKRALSFADPEQVAESRPGPLKRPTLGAVDQQTSATAEHLPERPSLSASKRASFDGLSSMGTGLKAAGPRRPSIDRRPSVSSASAPEAPPTAGEDDLMLEEPPAASTPPLRSSFVPGSTPLAARIVPPSPGVWASSPGLAIRPTSPAVSRMSISNRGIPDDKILEEMEGNPTAAWRNGVRQENLDAAEEGPTISIEQFFEMTGTKFMDDMAGPRRSTIRPSQLRRSIGGDSDGTTSLADYFAAMALDVPQLKLYSKAAEELNEWIDYSKGTFEQANEEAKQVTPELFLEYLEADEDNKTYLVHQLKLIKVNCLEVGKSTWYGWKMEWVKQLTDTAEQAFADIQADSVIFADALEKTGQVLPALRAEYESVMRELAEEEALVAEVAQCDQEYLEELKATIAEQNVALDNFRSDVAERNLKLQRINERIVDTQQQTQEGTRAIAEAQRILDVQQGSTEVEVFRMKDELEFLEDLHMWRLTKLSSDYLEIVYDSRFRVAVPCRDFQPVVDSVQLSRVKSVTMNRKGWFPGFDDLALEVAQTSIAHHRFRKSRDLVQFLCDHWDSCAMLRKQLHLLIAQHAYETAVASDSSSCTVTVHLLFERLRAKASVSFKVPSETISSWPARPEDIEITVSVAYGTLKSSNVRNVLLEYLNQSHPSDNMRWFSDCCKEVVQSFQ